MKKQADSVILLIKESVVERLGSLKNLLPTAPNDFCLADFSTEKGV